MNLPKLQAVGSDLNRVEQQLPEQRSGVSELAIMISANELIMNTLLNLISNEPMSPALAHTIHKKIGELEETLGEQQLSLQLLRLLEITKGEKGLAAQWLKDALDQVYGNNNQYL